MTIEEKAKIIWDLNNKIIDSLPDDIIVDVWLAEGPADGSTHETILDDLQYEESWFDDWFALANSLLKSYS